MKIIISVLIALITGILIVTYVKISKPEIDTNIDVKENNLNRLTPSKGLNFSFKSYNFPARELFMKIDFKEYKNIILYKVTINANDEYALFNIRAILDDLNIAYSIMEKKKTEIYVLFKSIKEAEKVLMLFKNYNLNVKIKKIIKRI